jgi:hypothetical protein
MAAATFWVVHPPSKSRALVEFTLQDKKIRLSSFFFTQGNVVDINTIREIRQRAKAILVDGSSPFLPFSG